MTKINSNDFFGHSPLYVSRLYLMNDVEKILLDKKAELNDLEVQGLDIFKAIENNDKESF